jgi:diadenosine tetraphosphate (Ap4A) HIT family hydrolase
MNPTIDKFGYPGSLIREYDHWVVLLRPAQVTLGSLVLAAKSDAQAYSALPPEAFAEQGRVVAHIERALAAFCAYEKINYLMLMMVDREVHFHVFPRYSGSRTFEEMEFPDHGWPGQPELGKPLSPTPEQAHRIRERLMTFFANL